MNDKPAIVSRAALCFTLLLAATSAGCAPEEASTGEAAGAESAETDTSQSALCFLPPTLPASYSADETVTVDWYSDGEEIKVNSPSSGYGNGECDRFAVKYVNIENARVRAGVTIANQADCQNTTVSAQFYTRTSPTSGWTLGESVSVQGVWTQGACKTVTDTFSAPWPIEDILVRGQVRRFLPGNPISGYTNLRVSIIGTAPDLPN